MLTINIESAPIFCEEQGTLFTQCYKWVFHIYDMRTFFKEFSEFLELLLCDFQFPQRQWTFFESSFL